MGLRTSENILILAGQLIFWRCENKTVELFLLFHYKLAIVFNKAVLVEKIADKLRKTTTRKWSIKMIKALI